MALAGTAHADTILGVYLGAGAWYYSTGGQFEDTNNSPSTTIYIDGDLGFGDNTGGYFYLAFEHFVPFLPNVKVEYTGMDATSKNTITEALEFEGETFAIGDTVDSTINVSHTDLIFYYELLDNWVNLDLGITARIFDGEISLESSSVANASQSLDFTIPLLYGKAKFELPFTGWYLSIEGDYIGYSGSTYSDIQGSFGWESSIGLGFEAGYRAMVFDLDDIQHLNTNIEFKGSYAALTYHF